MISTPLGTIPAGTGSRMSGPPARMLPGIIPAGVELESITQLLQGQFPGGTSGENGCGVQPALSGKQSSSLAVSDGDRVAVGTSQGLLLATPQGDPERTVTETLPGVETPSVLAFSPGAGDRLASANGTTVALWSLGKTAPTMHRLGVSVPDGASVPSQLPHRQLDPAPIQQGWG